MKFNIPTQLVTSDTLTSGSKVYFYSALCEVSEVKTLADGTLSILYVRCGGTSFPLAKIMETHPKGTFEIPA